MNATATTIPAAIIPPADWLTPAVAEEHPAIEYISNLFGQDPFAGDEDDNIFFMRIRNKKDRRNTTGRDEVHLSGLKTISKAASPATIAQLEKFQSAGFDIYVCMNPFPKGTTERKQRLVLNVRNLFIDADGTKPTLQMVEDAVRANEIPAPHSVLESSPGKCHICWHVAGFTSSEAKAMLVALAEKFGGDPASTDLHRVLRLPGFRNFKYDSQPICKLLEFHPEIERYPKELFKVATTPVASNGAPIASSELAVIAKYLEENAAEAKFALGARQDDGDAFKWEFECPWASEHSTGNPTAAVMLFEDGSLQYKCFHGHCNGIDGPKRGWSDIRALWAERVGHRQKFGNPPLDASCLKTAGLSRSVEPVEAVSPNTTASVSEQQEDVTAKPVESSLIPASAVVLPADAAAHIDGFFYHPGDKIIPRVWIHEGFNALATKTIWIGPEKAEKSLFALRKAMHEACGADWFGYHSTGPIKVSYFDAENPVEDIDDRYKELLSEFSPEQQVLINENLRVFKGRAYLQTKCSFDFENTSFWKDFAEKENKRGSVSYYFDCLYQFHYKQAKDNEGLKDVIDSLHGYVGLQNAFTMMHHTHKEMNEDLGKQSKTALRFIGARSWSNKIYGGGHVKKMADIVACQERFEVREGSEVQECFLDFAVFSRIAPDSPLLSFEDDIERKYKRNMVISLSAQANQVLYALADARGPWQSMYQAAKAVASVCSKRKAYERLKELVTKGYLLEGRDGCLVLRAGSNGALRRDGAEVQAEMTEEHAKSTRKWLQNLMGDSACSVESVKAMAKRDGYNWESIRKNRGAWGIRSFELNGSQMWQVCPQSEQQTLMLSWESTQQIFAVGRGTPPPSELLLPEVDDKTLVTLT